MDSAMNVEVFINELVAALENAIMGPDGDAILAGLGVLSALVVGLIAISVITVLIRVVCRWRIFNKAGEKGWKALIPVYNTYTEFAISWSKLQGILMLAALVIGRIICFYSSADSIVYSIGGIIGLYSAILALIQTHKLSRSFGKKFGFTLGLYFFNSIFMLILAFGKKSQYVGPAVKVK